MLGIGAVRQTFGHARGIGAAPGGTVGYVQNSEGKEIFFATFILFFVSMIV